MILKFISKNNLLIRKLSSNHFTDLLKKIKFSAKYARYMNYDFYYYFYLNLGMDY